MEYIDNNPAMSFLASHFENIRRRLKAEGIAAKSFGHGLNRGLIREAFIREFLGQNISDIWGIGTGEIIHQESEVEERRNQIDVVIHNKRYPKLSLATGIDLFFVESVSSFIEIKSKLEKDDLRKTAATTKRIKSQANFPRQRLNPAGVVRKPRPYSFIFSYDGPKRIETVLGWMKEISEEDDYSIDSLREAAPNERHFFDHHFVDGVFILGRGFVLVDAFPTRSHIASAIEAGENVPPNSVWVWGKDKELLVLWAQLNEINKLLLWGEHDLLPYIGTIDLWLEDDDADSAEGS